MLIISQLQIRPCDMLLLLFIFLFISQTQIYTIKIIQVISLNKNMFAGGL